MTDKGWAFGAMTRLDGSFRPRARVVPERCLPRIGETLTGCRRPGQAGSRPLIVAYRRKGFFFYLQHFEVGAEGYDNPVAGPDFTEARGR